MSIKKMFNQTCDFGVVVILHNTYVPAYVYTYFMMAKYVWVCCVVLCCVVLCCCVVVLLCCCVVVLLCCCVVVLLLCCCVVLCWCVQDN